MSDKRDDFPFRGKPIYNSYMMNISETSEEKQTKKLEFIKKNLFEDEEIDIVINTEDNHPNEY